MTTRIYPSRWAKKYAKQRWWLSIADSCRYATGYGRDFFVIQYGRNHPNLMGNDVVTAARIAWARKVNHGKCGDTIHRDHEDAVYEIKLRRLPPDEQSNPQSHGGSPCGRFTTLRALAYRNWTTPSSSRLSTSQY